MFLKRLGIFIVNFLYPPICPICGTRVVEAHCLCSDCYKRLNFITNPCCQVCGRPFEYKGLNDLICGACLKKKPAFSMARSVLEYDDFSKQLILAYKHGDRTDLTPLLTKFLIQAESIIFQDVDMIIPVPLHWTRFLHRRYNQSSLLGKALGIKLKIPFNSNILKRIRMTESQGKKTHHAREKNIKNAFRVVHSKTIQGKTILLIDDVMTTGATIQECTKTLRKAGAKEVKVLTLYRVIRL